MNRRQFLALFGGAAAFVAVGGVPIGALDTALRVGDVFTIEGYYVVNYDPSATPVLQQFVVVDSFGPDRVEFAPYGTTKSPVRKGWANAERVRQRLRRAS